MKKNRLQILGVVGSPREKGNTDILVSKILEGAEFKGAEIQTIRLGGLKIDECIGCHACWAGKGCVKKDDMSGLYAEIIQSDLLVLGTPVYWYGPTALMKGFIDRLVYFNGPQNHELIRNKPAIIVIPFEETNLDTVTPLIQFLERCAAYLEIKIIDRLIVPGVSGKGEVKQNPDWLLKAYEIGEKWGQGIKKR